ncbi:MAG: excinuclease ABC subunit C [Deltaproteobacteria bacterium CG1_02_45_11]|nr:MAG: excinuclease ABC subunit C [Deltaproteobacteria bacterium CG1_02_45_11]
MFYVYVLQSKKDNQWYTGYTDDLRRRFEEHNKGLNYATRKRRPFKLIYYEACINEQDAKTREQYLKSGVGKRYIKNRLKFYFFSGLPRKKIEK